MRQIKLTKLAPVAMLIMVTGVGGYYLGTSKNPTSLPSVQEGQDKVLSASSLFKTQTATVQGQITKITDSTLTVKDEKNKEEEFSISEKIVIYKSLKEDPKRATASSDINSVETNKVKVIMLEVINGKYQVVSISDLPKM